MAELDRNLRDYIDGIAQPVTMNELATRPTRDPGPRRSPVYAVLAGAAIVLIPMLALVAITLWPNSEESADPPITTPSTTIPPPTSTTLPPVGLVAVPDLIGLDQASAVEAAVAAGFEVEASERFSDSAQAGVGGRSVVLVNESGDMITPDHYGSDGNVAPDPTYLVVLEGEDASHRIEVARGRNDGGVHDRVITIEDFDGRRVIISRRPGEPAGADVTFLMLELACPDGCLQVAVTQPGSAALTGTVDVSVPLEFGLDTVAACSAAPQPATPVDAGLPATVRAARDAMLFWAEICEVAVLHDQAANEPTDLAFGRDTAGIVGAEALGVPALGQLIEALAAGVPGSFADDGGPTSYVWPGLADPTIDWSTMTDAEADRLAAIHGSQVVAEARSLGFYGGWYVIMDENGSWRFLGTDAP